VLPRSVTVDVSSRGNRIGNASEKTRAGLLARGHKGQGGSREPPPAGSNSAEHGGSTVRSCSYPQKPMAEGLNSSNYESTALSRHTDMMPVSTPLGSLLSNALLGRFHPVLLQFSTIKFFTDIRSLISEEPIRARNRGCFRFSHNSAGFQRLTRELSRPAPLSTVRIFSVLVFSSFFPRSIPFGLSAKSALHSREDFANIPKQFYSTIGSR